MRWSSDPADLPRRIWVAAASAALLAARTRRTDLSLQPRGRAPARLVTLRPGRLRELVRPRSGVRADPAGGWDPSARADPRRGRVMLLIPAPAYSLPQAAWIPRLVIWRDDGRFDRREGCACGSSEGSGVRR
jgi:hypothetical protein